MNKLSAFYVTRKWPAVFETARHWMRIPHRPTSWNHRIYSLLFIFLLYLLIFCNIHYHFPPLKDSTSNIFACRLLRAIKCQQSDWMTFHQMKSVVTFSGVDMLVGLIIFKTLFHHHCYFYVNSHFKTSVWKDLLHTFTLTKVSSNKEGTLLNIRWSLWKLPFVILRYPIRVCTLMTIPH